MEFHDRYFTKAEIIKKFRVFEGKKTFGEVDVRNVFSRQVPSKGIAGCVIEQSVLFMQQNSKQEADLMILQADGSYKNTELKVTGVKPSKNPSEKYCAKEPMSITAVSIGTIEHETFLGSHFYNKISHMLIVFYVYMKKPKQRVVPYMDYKRFPILGYQFLDIADDSDELAKFENDWLQVQNYLRSVENLENKNDLYPLLHQSIKKNLFYIDIAPRFKMNPNQTPRFRLKKSYVNAMFQDFYNHRLVKLPEKVNSYAELEQKLHVLTEQYRGRTLEELITLFKIQTLSTTEPRMKLPKQAAETVVVRMLDGKAKKISNIELFSKIGLIAKTIAVTKEEKETEDMKLFPMNLEEIRDTFLEYEDTSFYDFFRNHQLLCIMFQKPSPNASLKDNIFLGFKRIAFNDEMANGVFKDVYQDICEKINNNGVVEGYCYSKKNGKQQINKTGVPKVTLNFVKRKNAYIFVRGAGRDSTKKPWTFKGQAADGSDTIYTYPQWIWLKGRYLSDLLTTNA